MKNLSDFLTKNPTLVVVVFLLSLSSTVVTLVLGAKDIYADYLSKSVSLPAWLLLLALVVLPIGWVIYGSRTKLRKVRPHELVADQKFGVESIDLGGRRFINCKFDGTELRVDGRPFDFENCKFERHRFSFDGPAAQTIAILSGMYQDPPFQPMIEDMFIRIRKGSVHGDESND